MSLWWFLKALLEELRERAIVRSQVDLNHLSTVAFHSIYSSPNTKLNIDDWIHKFTTEAGFV